MYHTAARLSDIRYIYILTLPLISDTDIKGGNQDGAIIPQVNDKKTSTRQIGGEHSVRMTPTPMCHNRHRALKNVYHGHRDGVCVLVCRIWIPPGLVAQRLRYHTHAGKGATETAVTVNAKSGGQ